MAWRKGTIVAGALAGALLFAGSAASAQGEQPDPTPLLDRPGRAEVPGVEAGARAQPEVRVYPHLNLDVDLNLYAIGTPRATDRNREGFSTFLFGHINPGLHLSPQFSLQAFIHPDPAAGFEPNGSVAFPRRQNVILEQLFAEWRPLERLQLYGGKFNAPFGYGFEFFPGVLASFRAHDVYLIREQVGFGGNLELPLPAVLGEVKVSAAVFFLDTSFLANSLIVRRRFGDMAFNRFVRTTRHEGGPGNTGNLENFAISLEGAEIPAMPGVTWNLGLLSRAPGKEGTRRELGLAVGLRQEIAWPAGGRTLFFGEYVKFQNADGNPVEDRPDGLGPAAVSGRRRFSTLGAQMILPGEGNWRTTFTWQSEKSHRSFNPVPTQNWYELSVGRDLPWGFGLDVGYQFARFARTDTGRLGESHSVVARLNFRHAP